MSNQEMFAALLEGFKQERKNDVPECSQLEMKRYIQRHANTLKREDKIEVCRLIQTKTAQLAEKDNRVFLQEIHNEKKEVLGLLCNLDQLPDDLLTRVYRQIYYTRELYDR